MNAPEPLLPEEPLDRLNYFNGQRLEAADFRLEQSYQMRVRRWLNRSLYSPGIAAGLEVSANPDDRHSVLVSPGLALDVDGREIIVIEEQVVRAKGVPRRADGVQFGNYLVASYAEEKVAPVKDGCQVSVNGNGCGCGGRGCSGCAGDTLVRGTGRDLGWGAPSRVRSLALLQFQDAWPTDTQRRILLAQVVLNEQCQVEEVKTGMRSYAAASRPPTTSPISIEGEKDIDSSNPKILRFHIEEGFPHSARLYLQGAAFSSLYYTELGRHAHDIDVTMDPVSHDFTHTHAVDQAAETGSAGTHSHDLMLDGGNPNDGVDRNNRNPCVWTGNVIRNAGGHTHSINDVQIEDALSAWQHEHPLVSSLGNTGATGISARVGGVLGHIDDLQITFNGTDVTPQVVAQLETVNPGSWTTIGDGLASHRFVSDGTGAIDLRQLGVELSPGRAHTLIFSVASGGGQLQYNLYVD